MKFPSAYNKDVIQMAANDSMKEDDRLLEYDLYPATLEFFENTWYLIGYQDVKTSLTITPIVNRGHRK